MKSELLIKAVNLVRMNNTIKLVFVHFIRIHQINACNLYAFFAGSVNKCEAHYCKLHLQQNILLIPMCLRLTA